MIKIAVVLEKCEEGGYSVHVPTVPGCFGAGQSIEEALLNISEAIEFHLDALEDDLIVDEEAIVKELIWERERGTPPHLAPVEKRAPDRSSFLLSIARVPTSEPDTQAVSSSQYVGRRPRGVGFGGFGTTGERSEGGK